MDIHTLHGFLGLPEDWIHFPNGIHHSLYEEQLPFWKWAEKFNRSIKGTQNALVGYSLGGRLALHALIDNPKKWKCAVIISAHPGLESLPEKSLRLETDSLWAERFLNDSWESVIDQWNRQPIFANAQTVKRIEKNYCRSSLARILATWSLGKQENLRTKIAKLDLPILWITGKNDPKFSSIPISLSHPLSKKWVASQSGHRVPWESYKNILKLVNQFFQEIL